MGVGAGVGFGSEAAACWPGAVAALETKARIINKHALRIDELISGQKALQQTNERRSQELLLARINESNKLF
jgi:hypothetical protein